MIRGGRVLTAGTHAHLVPWGGWVILAKTVSFGVLTVLLQGQKMPIFIFSNKKQCYFGNFIEISAKLLTRHIILLCSSSLRENFFEIGSDHQHLNTKMLRKPSMNSKLRGVGGHLY